MMIKTVTGITLFLFVLSGQDALAQRRKPWDPKAEGSTHQSQRNTGTNPEKQDYNPVRDQFGRNVSTLPPNPRNAGPSGTPYAQQAFGFSTGNLDIHAERADEGELTETDREQIKKQLLEIEKAKPGYDHLLPSGLSIEIVLGAKNQATFDGVDNLTIKVKPGKTVSAKAIVKALND